MIQRIFIDTNIILDLLGERDPFYKPIAQMATLAENGEIVLVATPLSFATVNYVLTKFENRTLALEKLRKFSVLCEIAIMDSNTVNKALQSSLFDFEDALQYCCALDSNCDMLISRNGKDFNPSQLPVMTAGEFLVFWQNGLGC
jgi:predicted nucleic acid-binding protein